MHLVNISERTSSQGSQYWKVHRGLEQADPTILHFMKCVIFYKSISKMKRDDGNL
jgi:hypothetical protein